MSDKEKTAKKASKTDIKSENIHVTHIQPKKNPVVRFVMMTLRIIALAGFAVASYVIFEDLHYKEEARRKAEDRANRANAQLQEIKNHQYKEVSHNNVDEVKPDNKKLAAKDANYHFLYQELLKEKANIEELKAHFHYLDEELVKIKHSNSLGKILISYISLREQIFFNGDKGIGTYIDNLKNFEILIGINNQELNSKIEALKVLLPSLKSQKELSKEFDNLIPELIIAKRVGDKDDLASKIRYNLSKMVVIRRLNDKSPEQIDGVISRIERLIKRQDYRGALNRIRSLSPIYGNILVNFANDLEVALRVQKIDNEVLSYLKKLS